MISSNAHTSRGRHHGSPIRRSKWTKFILNNHTISHHRRCLWWHGMHDENMTLCNCFLFWPSASSELRLNVAVVASFEDAVNICELYTATKPSHIHFWYMNYDDCQSSHVLPWEKGYGVIVVGTVTRFFFCCHVAFKELEWTRYTIIQRRTVDSIALIFKVDEIKRFSLIKRHANLQFDAYLYTFERIKLT